MLVLLYIFYEWNKSDKGSRIIETGNGITAGPIRDPLGCSP